MHEILNAAFAKDQAAGLSAVSSILVPLVEHECDLKNELLILKDSIRAIMRAVLKMSDVNSFGHFLLKDELLNRFFQDYFFIKKSGLIPCVYRQYRAAAAKAAAFGNLPADGRGVCQPETGERIAGKRSHRSAVC